jgi:hypothetical protein
LVEFVELVEVPELVLTVVEVELPVLLELFVPLFVLVPEL